MNSRERVQGVFCGERPDRYPCYEHFWSETLEEWKSLGLIGDNDVEEYFDFDIGNLGNVIDLTAQFPEEVLEEDGDYRILKDSRGVTAKHFKGKAGYTPHWIETPVKKPSDWWDYKKHIVFSKNRIDQSAFDKSNVMKIEDKFSCIFLGDPYEQAWPVFGQVQMFIAMMEDRDVVRDAMQTWAALTMEGLDYCIKSGLSFDGVFFYGDMAYRNGPLFSLDVYEDMIMPAHLAITDYLHGMGKKVILHSCGQIKSFIPKLIEVGFDALQPLEAKCDQDVRLLVGDYRQDLVFFGNMDVRILSTDKEAITSEVESKLSAFDGSWNYIFHSDHSIPPTVSYDNYRWALDTARDYLQKV